MKSLLRLYRRARRWKVAVAIEETTNEFLHDNCTHLAAGISYYLLFSLFPLALAAVSVMGFVLALPKIEADLTAAIREMLPVAGDSIASIAQAVIRARGGVGIVATLGLLWAGSSFFNAIRKSLNTAWGTRQPRPYFKERLMEFVMMVGAGFLLLTSLAVTTGLRVLREVYKGAWYLQNDLLWYVAGAALAAGLTYVTFLSLYKWIPNRPQRWRDVWAGALVATVSFEVVKHFFIWFVGAARYSYVYGSIGAIIALLTWCYVSSLILLYCAKLSAVYPRVAAAYASQPPKLAETRPGPRRASLFSRSSIGLAMITLTAIGFDTLRRLTSRSRG